MDAMEVVATLNDGWQGQDDAPFEYCTDGVRERVTFFKRAIWSSEEDLREWINISEQEPLSEYLIREAEKIIAAAEKHHARLLQQWYANGRGSGDKQRRP